MWKFALPLAALPLACATQPEPDDGACPIAASEGWRAWIDAMPGPEPQRLIVTGRVTVPTGGWRLSLELGPTREIDPPVQEVVLRAEPPTGGATQAIVTHEVTGRFRALPRYGAVVVRCGGETLAEISPVEQVW
ncbi:MAG: hypothetical protein M3N07_03155 [Pseudomonadota bacterium]|nr:hypothetical protein [Pseudomonadota bacterium]